MKELMELRQLAQQIDNQEAVSLYNKVDKEIERLKGIIKEAIEYIESYIPNYDFDKTNLINLLEILNKVGEE